jgi:hypothetical protein
MIKSREVTAEAAVQYDGGNLDAIKALGARVRETGGGGVELLCADDGWWALKPGSHVIEYKPGEFGIASDGAWRVHGWHEA